jgi:hypothetical protein
VAGLPIALPTAGRGDLVFARGRVKLQDVQDAAKDAVRQPVKAWLIHRAARQSRSRGRAARGLPQAPRETDALTMMGQAGTDPPPVPGYGFCLQSFLLVHCAGAVLVKFWVKENGLSPAQYEAFMSVVPLSVEVPSAVFIVAL